MTTDTQPGAAPAEAAPVRSISIDQIMKAIPHRYPFLLVDRVDIVEEDKRAVGIKCVTMNEEFFKGHFPDFPIMPGVLILEALAQTACVMLLSKPGMEGKQPFFMGIDGAKFRQPVRPGMVLKLHVEILRAGSRAGKFRGEAKVDGQLVAEAEMSFAVGQKSAA